MNYPRICANIVLGQIYIYEKYERWGIFVRVVLNFNAAVYYFAAVHKFKLCVQQQQQTLI